MARREKPPSPIGEQDPWRSDAVKEGVLATRMDGTLDFAERFDAYVNKLTGIGDWLQDKSFGGSAYGLEFTLRYISGFDAENRWRGSDLGASIVEKLPDEMTREGWEISVQPSDDDEEQEPEETTDGFGFPAEEPAAPVGPLPEIDDSGTDIVEAMEGRLEELGASESLLAALQYERAFGGGAILIGADDGLDLHKPLDEQNISTVRYLNVLQGGREGEIIAWSYYNDPRAAKYGEPEVYLVRNTGVVTTKAGIPGQVTPPSTPIQPMFFVHETRLLIFPGQSVSKRARYQMRGWGDSIFTRVEEVLSQYSQTWAGVANLMTDFKQDVLSIDGSAQKMAGGDKASKGRPLTARARTIQQTKSVARMLVIDKLTESFQRETVSVAGLSELLQQFALRLAAAADMPVALLFGQAPAGLNATGASDIRFFYDRVASKQRRYLIPRLRRVIRILFLAKDSVTGGKEPTRWSVTPRSLYQLSDLEKATLRKTDAETDHLRIQDGILDPPEVTASAYGGSDYSSVRTIDIDGRRMAVEKDLQERAARQKAAEEVLKQPPPAPPPDPAQVLPPEPVVPPSGPAME